jgi:3-methyladenine DNA glycosylase AlkD
MELAEVMTALERVGTEQNRKIYTRHGVTGPCFGVSYGELGTLAHTIGTDHDLAGELWATGNHDARELAGKIADPDRLTRAEADRWARDADNYVTAGTVAGVVSRRRWARRCSDDWRDRRSEWVASVGWGIVSHTAEDRARRSILAASRRIGPIAVDHGETACVTPEVAPYVERTLAHRARRPARATV